jgi:hypothetical protein
MVNKMIVLCFVMIVCNSFSAQFVATNYNGHMYVITTNGATWNAAYTVATNYHGYLVIVNNSAENSFLYNSVNPLGITTISGDGGGARYVWLGGTDEALEGTWKWVDGSTFYTAYTPVLYENWAKGGWYPEPDNAGPQNHLAMGLSDWPDGMSYPDSIGTTSMWNDVMGTCSLAYIVEFDNPSADSDNDRLNDWQEFMAGTDPNNPASNLYATNAVIDNGVVRFSIPANDKRDYVLQTVTDITKPWSNAATYSGVNGLINISTNQPETVKFYKVKVIPKP